MLVVSLSHLGSVRLRPIFDKQAGGKRIVSVSIVEPTLTMYHRPEAELRTLSQETLLKLEKRYAAWSSRRAASYLTVGSFYRRTWFLERVLKLNMVPIAKEYTCVRQSMLTRPNAEQALISTCHCAWLNSALHVQIHRTAPDCWTRNGNQELARSPGSVSLAVFNNTVDVHATYLRSTSPGPIQPSMVFRYLRSLEGGSQTFTLTHHACQQTAKLWVSTCKRAPTRRTLSTYRFQAMY